MTFDLVAKLAALEQRVNDQDEWVRSLRYENECVKKELKALRESHGLLADDHILLADHYLESHRKIYDHLQDHVDEIKVLALVAGNTAGHVFPSLGNAFREIELLLGGSIEKYD